MFSVVLGGLTSDTVIFHLLYVANVSKKADLNIIQHNII